MRFIENQQYRPDYAEALHETHRLDIPEGCKNGLDYVQQYIDYTTTSAEIFRCYLPEKYADDLVEIRDASSSRDLNAAISTLCVDGQTSQQKTGLNTTVVKFTIESNLDAIQELRELARSASKKSITKDIYSIRNILEKPHASEEIEMYLPIETIEYLQENSTLVS